MKNYDHPLTTTCPFCGHPLLTLSGVLVTLDETDERKNALEGLEIACTCEMSKHAEEEQKLAEEASRCSKKAKAQAAALSSRLFASGMPEPWHIRGLSAWVHDTPAQQAALEQAVAFGQAVRSATCAHSLYIAGDIGTGKTMLASCLAADLIRRRVPVRWCNVADVLRAIRSCFDKKGRTEDEVIQSFISPQVLVLDDLGKERPTEWALEQLFAVINARYDACKPLIVTTNYGGTDLVHRLTPKGETDDTTARAIVDRLRETSIVIKLVGKSWR